MITQSIDGEYSDTGLYDGFPWYSFHNGNGRASEGITTYTRQDVLDGWMDEHATMSVTAGFSHSHPRDIPTPKGAHPRLVSLISIRLLSVLHIHIQPPQKSSCLNRWEIGTCLYWLQRFGFGSRTRILRAGLYLPSVDRPLFCTLELLLGWLRGDCVQALNREMFRRTVNEISSINCNPFQLS